MLGLWLKPWDRFHLMVSWEDPRTDDTEIKGISNWCVWNWESSPLSYSYVSGTLVINQCIYGHPIFKQPRRVCHSSVAHSDISSWSVNLYTLKWWTNPPVVSSSKKDWCGFKSMKFSLTYSYTVLKLDYARLNACAWGLGTIKIRDLMASDSKWPNNVIPIAFEVDSSRICDVSCDLRRCAGATPLSHLSPLDLLPFATSLPFHLHQPLQSLGNSWRWWNPSLNGENGLQSMPKNLLY